MVAYLEIFLRPDASVSELHHSSLALLKLNRPLDSAKISKLLLGALKKEQDSLTSTGLALHLASNLKGSENLNLFFEKIRDIIALADEVDGKYLQVRSQFYLRPFYSRCDIADSPIISKHPRTMA